MLQAVSNALFFFFFKINVDTASRVGGKDSFASLLMGCGSSSASSSAADPPQAITVVVEHAPSPRPTIDAATDRHNTEKGSGSPAAPVISCSSPSPPPSLDVAGSSRGRAPPYDPMSLFTQYHRADGVCSQLSSGGTSPFSATPIPPSPMRALQQGDSAAPTPLSGSYSRCSPNVKDLPLDSKEVESVGSEDSGM